MVTDSLNEETANGAEKGDEGLASTDEKQKSPEELAAQWEAKAQESEKKYLYLYSDFENFRRRMERERLDFIKFGHEGFLRELVQVVDNFDRAISHAKSLSTEKGSPMASVCQGIEMIHFQMMEALKAQGVLPIVSVGEKFDPAKHEAVGEEESGRGAGLILKEMQKGYLLHTRLLRAAKVITSKN